MPTLPETDSLPGQAPLRTIDDTSSSNIYFTPGTEDSLTVRNAYNNGTVSVTAVDGEFDYSRHLDRVIRALERLAISTAEISANIATITSNTTVIAAQQTIIAQKLTLIEAHQKTMKDLGEGDGIHWRRPNEWQNGAATYRVSSGGTERQISTQNISETYTNTGGSE